MKKLYPLLILFAAPLLYILLTSELSSSGGSPGGKTGSPGDAGETCTQCHGGTATVQTGWITSTIPASGYVPGQTYTITASGTHTGVVKFGFEATAENAGGQKTGTFVITNSIQTKFTNNNKAVTHNSSGTTPSAGSKAWSFDWTAPSSNAGPITFYAAFNATNGNDTTTGDVIYRSQLTANPSTAGIYEADARQLRVFPNPAIDNIFVPGFENEDATAQVYSRDGRLVLDSRIDQAGKLKVDGLQAGTYILRVLSGAGTYSTLMVKK